MLNGAPEYYTLLMLSEHKPSNWLECSSVCCVSIEMSEGKVKDGRPLQIVESDQALTSVQRGFLRLAALARTGISVLPTKGRSVEISLNRQSSMGQRQRPFYLQQLV